MNLAPSEPEFVEFHSSSKSGPNGRALVHSLIDFTLIPTPLFKDFFKLAGSELESRVIGLRRSSVTLKHDDGRRTYVSIPKL